MKKGDVLYVPSLNHLGNNLKEISSAWNSVVNDVKADSVVLDGEVFDTRNSDPDKREELCQIIEYFAQSTYKAAQKRIIEGVRAAQKRGVRVGNKKSVSDRKMMPYYERWKAGEITQKQAAQELRLTQSAVSYRFLQYKDRGI